MKEIEQKLPYDNVCSRENLPSVSYISKGYTNKKIKSIPLESQTPESQPKYDDYMSYVRICLCNHYIFDESSLVKTIGKRKYGSSETGKRAIEIQPYASNANFTFSLFTRGIDYYNIIEGPSNGQEIFQ